MEDSILLQVHEGTRILIHWYSQYIYQVNRLQRTTVVVAYINTMKTTFDFNFDLYQAFKQQHINMETKKLFIKKASF